MVEESHSALRVKEFKPEWLDSPDGLKRLLAARYELAKSVMGTERNPSLLTALARLMRLAQGIEQEYTKKETQSAGTNRGQYDPWITWVHQHIGNSVHPASPRAFLEAHKRIDMASAKGPWGYFSNIGASTLATLRDVLKQEHLLER